LFESSHAARGEECSFASEERGATEVEGEARKQEADVLGAEAGVRGRVPAQDGVGLGSAELVDGGTILRRRGHAEAERTAVPERSNGCEGGRQVLFGHEVERDRSGDMDEVDERPPDETQHLVQVREQVYLRVGTARDASAGDCPLRTTPAEEWL